MSVFYRYRSAVQTFSVPVPGPSVSVADLKRLILGTSRHGHGRMRGRGPRETVALSNADTGEEYTNGSALVPRDSTVVVRRVAGPAAETIVESSPQVPRSEQKGSSSSDKAAAGSSASSTGAKDDEAKATSEVIDAAQLNREDTSQGAQNVPMPPPGYVCRRCRVPGHFIQHCPTNGDPRFDLGRAMATPVLPPAPVPASPDDGIPAELHCKICKKVMADAVISKCCFYSLCDRCIRDHITAKSKCVCGAQARVDDVVPNMALRALISTMIATNAGSSPGGSDKPRSSAGSKPASQSPAASQERHGHVASKKAAPSEHSDGSGSEVVDPTKFQETSPRASHADQDDNAVPFSGPACYDPNFGATPWLAADPCMYYGDMPGPPPQRHSGFHGYHDDTNFGATPWATDPCMYYGGMPYPTGGNMPGPAPPRDSGFHGYHDDARGRKRTRTFAHGDGGEDHSFERSCSRSRSQVVLT